MIDVSSGWSRRTCSYSERPNWSEDHPYVGQDQVTALFLYREYGYPIYSVIHNGEQRYYNKNENNNIVDLNPNKFPDAVYALGNKADISDLWDKAHNQYQRLIDNLGVKIRPHNKVDYIISGKLDANSEYYNYNTSDIIGKDYVDVTTTGDILYDKFLTIDASILNRSKLKDYKGTIELLSPNEYYIICSNLNHGNVERLKWYKGIKESDTIEYLMGVITMCKKKFPMPFVNLINGDQEGLHRMYCLATLTSWDTKFPVLVVRKKD